VSASASLGAGTLAALFVRSRLRSFRNGLRARGRRRAPVVIAVAGVLTSLAYIGLFSQAFSVVVATVDLAGQTAALAVVAGTLAFGSFLAKAASSEAMRAGSAENEFLLARPVSLAALVAGRGIADAVTDPMGALFLFPVLLAAALVWRLSPASWLVAVAISAAVQVAISMLAYATQLVVVRGVAPAHRRLVWMGLRFCAALALSGLWLVGTWVLRTPAALATKLVFAVPWLKWTPGAWIVEPLAALSRGDSLRALAALGRLWAAAAAALWGAMAIARRAGMSGWEEAGAPWAEAVPNPRGGGRPVTAATKDLLLIVRDRGQLLVLIAMPAIFVGVQIFGAAGWSWSTATLPRVSCLAYSLALYMATIGPLTHMQAERRAFWILRTVPVPIERLLAAKARAWSAVVGGAAAFVFFGLALVMPPAPATAILSAAILVIGGAATISFLAVAMASGGADLSDDQSPAVGPATIYAFLLVGGLYNLVLTGDLPIRACGLLLYLFVTVAYWRAGVERAEICMDAEAVRTPRLRIADGATLLIVYALGQRGLATAATALHGEGAEVIAVLRLALALVLGATAGSFLRRGAGALPLRAVGSSLGIGVGLGALLAALRAGFGAVGAALPPHSLSAWLGLAAGLAAQEAIFRGVVQRTVEEDLAARGAGPWRARFAAAAVAAVLGVVAVAMGDAHPTRAVIAPLAAAQVAAALARALTGRLGSAWMARLAVVFGSAFF
jgi:hypothetical protein